jgi:homoserine kinase
MDVAIALEGHPDNVVPALLGGCRLAATAEDGSWTICQVPWHQEIVPIVAIPNFELSTAAARKVLPSSYSRADAIFNAAHLGMLMQGLATGEAESLRSSLQDRIHQPYRQALISGYEAVRTAALEAGSYGLVISGAGPTLLALTQADYSVAVKTAIAQVWTDLGIEVQVQALAIDREGATVKEG